MWLLQYAYSRSIHRRNYLFVGQFHKHVELSEMEGKSRHWSPTRLQQHETVPGMEVNPEIRSSSMALKGSMKSGTGRFSCVKTLCSAVRPLAARLFVHVGVIYCIYSKLQMYGNLPLL